MDQLGLFPDWSRRYRAVVARATSNSLGIARIPTRDQVLATRRTVRQAWWTRRAGGERGHRDIAADERLEAADEILLRASVRHYAATRGLELPVVDRVGRGHGGHERFLKYDATLTEAQRLEKKRARQQALRLERIANNLCAACGRPKDRVGKTCFACLDVDREWRADRSVREKTAEYLDAECQPLVLSKKTRMLPVIGERQDCQYETACLNELIAACGRQDPEGASCPGACKDYLPLDRKKQLELFAMGRTDGADSSWG